MVHSAKFVDIKTKEGIKDNCRLSYIEQKMTKIWIGKRESDILTYKYYDYSITFYGSNTGSNKSFCTTNRQNSSYSSEFIDFVLSHIKSIISKKNEYELHFYNNTFAYKLLEIAPEIYENIANINKLSVLNYLRHKSLSRLWLCNNIDTPAFCLLSKKECNIDNLKRKFGQTFSHFIIQKNYSGGGTGTYLICNSNQNAVLNQLSDYELFLVSPFYNPNKTYSCHVFIDKDKSIVLPISQQKLYTQNDKFEYIGNKYIDSNDEISMRIKNISHKICDMLRNIEYKGICGFDFIYYKEKIYLIEINPRYLGSSFAINKALKDNNLPSLFELNDMCFGNGIPNILADKLENLNISYSNTCLMHKEKVDVLRAIDLLNNKNELVFDDGLLNTNQYEEGCYLLRYISPDEEN